MATPPSIPAYGLYGEALGFPDLCHVETITDRAAGHDWRISPHRHEDLHQILFIRQGQTQLEADGHHVSLPAPIAINMPRRVVHGFTFESGTIGHVFTIPTAEVADVIDGPSPLSLALARPGWTRPPEDFEYLFDTLSRTHGSTSLARVARLRGLSTQLFASLAEALAEAAPTAPDRSPRILQKFDGFVRARLDQALTVADIAAALAISTSHLNRLVKQATGLPVLRAIEAMRMREACRQLAYTRRPIAAIGAEVGYPDPSYFSRAFQRHLGITPRDYRNRLSG